MLGNYSKICVNHDIYQDNYRVYKFNFTVIIETQILCLYPYDVCINCSLMEAVYPNICYYFNKYLKLLASGDLFTVYHSTIVTIAMYSQ